MQLNLRTSLIALFIIVFGHLFAQDEDSVKIHLEDIEIDFLINYYEQNGDMSPVTGGIGTEKLHNIAPALSIKLPITQKQTINLSGGIDYYTSASSDNIDNPFKVPDHITGASSKDARVYGTLGFEQKNKKKNTNYDVSLITSLEFDVKSIGVTASYRKTTKDNNKTLSIRGGYIFDKWKLIYPVELRNGQNELLKTDTRQSLNLSPSFSFVINKKMNADITTDFTFQGGLLSTPFHRVYFNGFDIGNQEDLLFSNIERLPDFRFKFPIAGKLNITLANFLIFKGSYRLYYDTWGILGNTIKAEFPIKIGNFMRLYPFYRFHAQTAATYYAPFAQHTGTEKFYTSDTDLSALKSHKFGMGVSIAPLYGIFRFKGGKKRLNMLKSIDFRYAHYRRSNGLTANIYTLSFSYVIQR